MYFVKKVIQAKGFWITGHLTPVKIKDGTYSAYSCWNCFVDKGSDKIF